MFRRTAPPPPAPPVRPVTQPTRSAGVSPTAQRELRAVLRDLAGEAPPAVEDRVSVIDLRDAVDEAIESLRR
jgi:hypothetical protein